MTWVTVPGELQSSLLLSYQNTRACQQPKRRNVDANDSASAFGFTPDQAGDAGAQTTAFRVDSGGEITVTYTNTDGTTGQPKIYNYQGTFFASKSATDLANAFGLGVTEEDEVVWVFAKQ